VHVAPAWIKVQRSIRRYNSDPSTPILVRSMARICIVYSTTDGHTLQICQRIRSVLEGAAHQVELIAVAAAASVDWGLFDKVVIGARIRYGKHHPQVVDLINTCAGRWQNMPSAFFSVNLVARKSGKDTPQTNPYARKLLRITRWQPSLAAVFAGKLDYQRYSFVDRHIIRFIMWLTHGPINLDACVDFTDWAAVDDFARRFSGY
jgi:menaquinone-dependent protoporphyrinogen oxidase